MDDKKKILILGALFVVMIGVGAFQFVKSGDPAPAATAEKKSETTPAGGASATVDTKSGPGESQGGYKAAGDVTVDPALIVAAKLEPRDPFDGRKWEKTEEVAPSVPPPAAPKRPASASRPPRGISGAGFRPAGVPIEGVLPEAGAPVAGAPQGQLPSVEDFPYVVAGTVSGDRPVVILTDPAGKQKIVPVGGQVDGDSQIVSISNGKVTVRHRGKTKTVPVGGTSPSNNKQEGN